MTDFRDRPGSLDSMGQRIPLFPAKPRGPWRRRRTAVQAVLLLIFLGLPWVHINGDPAILVDLQSKRLAFFGFKFFAHDGPLVFLLLGGFAIALALVTALWGRLWCGWACPQTVFIDGVIRRIEEWTEGNHLQRRALAAAPFSLGKAVRKTAKWVLFIGFSLLLTHSFLAYFFGTEHVLRMMTEDPRLNWGPFLFTMFVTGLVLFDLTWFREQLCLIVCPYGRIQSVLMDRQTVTVQYDAIRGEPRGARRLGTSTELGDCVDCKRCVSVCPTGIDIRNGIQLDCVGCTSCIDACDEIMEKMKRPKGLIAYRSSTNAPIQWLRPRVALYLALFVLISVSLIALLIGRAPFDATILRAIGAPFIEEVDGNGRRLIVNSYRLHGHNQTDRPLGLLVTLPPNLNSATLRFPESPLNLKPEESRMIPFIIEIPFEALHGQETLKLPVLIEDQTIEVEFVAPRS